MKLQIKLLLMLVMSFSLLLAKEEQSVVREVGLPGVTAGCEVVQDVVNAPLPQEVESISVKSKRAAKKTSVVLYCSNESELATFIKIITADLEFSDQFDLDLRHHKQLKNKKPDRKELKKLFDEGYDLVIYLFPTQDQPIDGAKKIYFNVYSTGVKGGAVFEKMVSFKKESVVAHAHTLASTLLQQLTGSSGLCTHTIAYCVKKSPMQKDIYMSDYLGNKIIPVVTGPGVKLAPTFHSKAGTNSKADILFYSLITRENVRQMMRDLKANRSETCFSFPGLNMQLSLAPDGIRAIVCLSGGKGNSELFHYDQRVCNKVGKKVFEQVTNNKGNNVCPCYLPNGDIVFCSDFETGFGRPQVYYLDRKKNKTIRLTSGKGYCAAPSYCAATHKVAYTRLINKQFQIFSIDLHQMGKVHQFDERQLTFCKGDKTEPQWDKTGKYLLFLYEFKGEKGHRTSELAWLNLNSDSIRLVPTAPELQKLQKSYPATIGTILY